MLLVMELLRRKDFQREEAPSHSWESGGSLILNKATSYIAANIREPLRVSKVSHACGVSESFLYKLFSSNLNVSPKEYILNCKMECLPEAAADLGASSWNVFRYVMFPLTIPAMISGVTMVFLPSMTNYVVLDMVYNSTYIMGSLMGSYFNMYDWHNGSMISIILLLIIFVLTWLTEHFYGKQGAESRGGGIW